MLERLATKKAVHCQISWSVQERSLTDVYDEQGVTCPLCVPLFCVDHLWQLGLLHHPPICLLLIHTHTIFNSRREIFDLIIFTLKQFSSKRAIRCPPGMPMPSDGLLPPPSPPTSTTSTPHDFSPFVPHFSQRLVLVYAIFKCSRQPS